MVTSLVHSYNYNYNYFKKKITQLQLQLLFKKKHNYNYLKRAQLQLKLKLLFAIAITFLNYNYNLIEQLWEALPIQILIVKNLASNIDLPVLFIRSNINVWRVFIAITTFLGLIAFLLISYLLSYHIYLSKWLAFFKS